MAEVRKHGQGRGGQIAAAIERAMAQGVRPSGAGAPPKPGDPETPAPRNTQNLVTATSFLGNDPFLVFPKTPEPTDSATPENGTGAGQDQDDEPDPHPARD